MKKNKISNITGILFIIWFIASIIGIVLSIEPFKVTVWNILIGVVTFIWGFLVTRALMKENKE